ncbi:hypothetical protein JKP88DRAFT_255779 [Tribonema minus]|uniref:Uncharacterized protein n=1 Tax=Tribonema minus TaxID=303371 RepID=A0A835YY00_9STRA|nr:hypothetical protein JKP88DRAFT_255779 [Tribonema minus]
MSQGFKRKEHLDDNPPPPARLANYVSKQGGGDASLYDAAETSTVDKLQTAPEAFLQYRIGQHHVRNCKGCQHRSCATVKATLQQLAACKDNASKYNHLLCGLSRTMKFHYNDYTGRSGRRCFTDEAQNECCICCDVSAAPATESDVPLRPAMSRADVTSTSSRSAIIETTKPPLKKRKPDAHEVEVTSPMQVAMVQAATSSAPMAAPHDAKSTGLRVRPTPEQHPLQPQVHRAAEGIPTRPVSISPPLLPSTTAQSVAPATAVSQHNTPRRFAVPASAGHAAVAAAATATSGQQHKAAGQAGNYMTTNSPARAVRFKDAAPSSTYAAASATTADKEARELLQRISDSVRNFNRNLVQHHRATENGPDALTSEEVLEARFRMQSGMVHELAAFVQRVATQPPVPPQQSSPDVQPQQGNALNLAQEMQALLNRFYNGSPGDAAP